MFGLLMRCLAQTLEDFEGDVETIENPKNSLKRLYHGFDEIEHGREIVARLDMRHILSRERHLLTFASDVFLDLQSDWRATRMANISLRSVNAAM